MEKFKKLKIDIMIKDRYFKTFTYNYCPLFILTYDELKQEGIKRFPSLKNKDFKLYETNQ